MKNIGDKSGDDVIKKTHIVINRPYSENSWVSFIDVRVDFSLASFYSNTSPLNRMYVEI
jgi:hypothetical protein